MEIKDYKAGDEIQILKLFRETFGKPMSEAYWKWRFMDNPECKVMIKLMWDNDILAGHYAVSPVTLNYQQERILSALSMTTMTHPAYTGRRIFTDLAEALYADEKEKNKLTAIWGFPNNNSHYGFIKNLKWNDLEQIPTFAIDVHNIQDNNSVMINTFARFEGKHIRSQSAVADGYSVRIDKTEAYLNWRYLNNPVNKYQMFEFKDGDIYYYAVTKIFTSFSDKTKYEIDILELNFPNDYTALSCLLSTIKEHYKNHALLCVNTWLPLSDQKHLSLEKLGFTNTTPITYSGIRVLNNKFSQMEQPKAWHYAMGDSDIY